MEVAHIDPIRLHMFLEVLSRSLNVFLTLFLEGKALSALSLRVFLCSNTFQSSAHVLPFFV
jgi:hypothetical protein